MGEGFEKVVEELERDLVEGISPIVVDHALNPRNVGSMEDADGFAQFTGPCGDTMEIWIKVRDGEIVRASFWTDGCGTTVASGSMVTELVKGKMVLDAMEITKEDVLSALGGLPEESEHCALLAATTLKLAIADYLRRKGSL